jgi:hypothetical protein
MEPEVMTYKTKGQQIMLTCTYSIKSDQLFLTKVSDDCGPRGHADASQPFDRVK